MSKKQRHEHLAQRNKEDDTPVRTKKWPRTPMNRNQDHEGLVEKSKDDNSNLLRTEDKAVRRFRLALHRLWEYKSVLLPRHAQKSLVKYDENDI